MHAEVACSNCQRSLRVAESSIGKKGKCPKCQTVFLMQATSQSPSKPESAPVAATAPISPISGTKIAVSCLCGANLKVAGTMQGKRIQCPKCKLDLVVPLAGPPQAAISSAGSPAGDDLWGNLDLPATAAPQFPTGGNGAEAYSYKPSPGDKKREKGKPLAPTGDAAERIAEASLAMESARTSHSSGSFGFEWSWLNTRLFFAFVAAIVASPFVLVSGCKEQRKQTLLAQDAGTTLGTITEAYEKRSRRGFRSYSVDVVYTVGEQLYEVNLSVDSTFFMKHVRNVGGESEPVVIMYAKADPSLSMIEGGGSNSYAGIGFGLSLLAFGIGGMCYLFFLAGD